MAVYSNLPVFKASYDLVIEVFKMCGSLPKDYKYTIGEKLKNALLDLTTGIYEANAEEDKLLVLCRCRKYMVEIKLYLRLLYDLKQISMKRFVCVTEQVEGVSKQINAWHKSALNRK